jgi:hypothetical protein
MAFNYQNQPAKEPANEVAAIAENSKQHLLQQGVYEEYLRVLSSMLEIPITAEDDTALRSQVLMNTMEQAYVDPDKKYTNPKIAIIAQVIDRAENLVSSYASPEHTQQQRKQLGPDKPIQSDMQKYNVELLNQANEKSLQEPEGLTMLRQILKGLEI